MNIEIKCTQEQKEKIQNSLIKFQKEITWEIIEMGYITDEEIDAFGKFTNEQKELIKSEYDKYHKGFFPNPMCVLY